EPESTEVRVTKQPSSTVYPNVPNLSDRKPKGQGPAEIHVSEDKDSCSIAQEIVQGSSGVRVGLVCFTAHGEPPSGQTPDLGEPREASLYLRTTYLQALQDMPRQLHADVGDVLAAGSVVLTQDVCILRGPVQDGARWLPDPVRVDVLTAAIQRHPRCDVQGQYARIAEKADVAKTVDHIFACAAANDVEVLIFPPLGVNGAAGCHHPAADAGDLLRKAILEHGQHVPRVWVCQEFPGQLKSSWATFASAVRSGREPLEHRELVPLTASPYLRPGWGEPCLSAKGQFSFKVPLRYRGRQRAVPPLGKP
ncbi:unnamed protein product, partial [Polarella glacialis]